MSTLGGRKFLAAMYAMTLVAFLAYCGKDATAYGSIALIAGAFIGGNAFVESRHAGAKSE